MSAVAGIPNVPASAVDRSANKPRPLVVFSSLCLPDSVIEDIL